MAASVWQGSAWHGRYCYRIGVKSNNITWFNFTKYEYINLWFGSISGRKICTVLVHFKVKKATLSTY